MELAETIALVRRYNAWRRNDDDSEMPHPKDIGQSLDAICDRAEELQAKYRMHHAEAERLERELKQIKAILADPLAVHLNMMRGTIQWTPANLRSLLGDSDQ